jgi:hypothetical protein
MQSTNIIINIIIRDPEIRSVSLLILAHQSAPADKQFCRSALFFETVPENIVSIQYLCEIF